MILNFKLKERIKQNEEISFFYKKKYKILTNEIYKEWSGFIAKEYKNYKVSRKESLRVNMTDIEVALADLGEIATRELIKKKNPKGLEENRKIAKKGGTVSNVARNQLESE